MIELKAITVEKDGYYEGNNINIELKAPFDFDVHKFYRQFHQLLDMENQGIRHRQFLRGRKPEFSLIDEVLMDTVFRGNLYDIHKIYRNPQKGTTVVLFKTDRFIMTNGKEHYFRIKVKRDSEDQDDIYMAVASAVMIRKYKSNSQFKAHIRRSIPKGSDGQPYVYQLMAAAEVSDIYGSWEKFCKIVDEKMEVYHGKRKETDAR